jgi:hypothetical protein
MSNLLSYIYDSYEDYKNLCTELNIPIKDIEDSSWYEDLRQLENNK